MKRNDDYLIYLWLLFLIAACMLTSCNSGLKKEIEQLREELARQQQYVPLHKDTIRDSVEIVTQKVVEVEKIKEVLTDEDRKLLKDAGIAAKTLLSLQKTSMETKDSVSLQAAASQQPKTPGDSIFVYNDAWASFEYQNKRLKYAVRDSLAIALQKEYKHRLLFFKWGTKGYKVNVMNFNPHATVRYNTYVKIRK